MNSFSSHLAEAKGWKVPVSWSPCAASTIRRHGGNGQLLPAAVSTQILKARFFLLPPVLQPLVYAHSVTKSE